MSIKTRINIALYFVILSYSVFMEAQPVMALVDENKNSVTDIYEDYISTYLYDIGAANEDFDSDGISNIEELRAGTYPCYCWDFLSVDVEYSLDTGSITPYWWGVKGKRYIIERSFDLVNWTRISGPYFGADDWLNCESMLTSGAEAVVFYRVAVSDWDSDGDGLDDFEEYWLGTNSAMADSDSDGVPDGYEYLNGHDPNCADAYLKEIQPPINLAFTTVEVDRVVLGWDAPLENPYNLSIVSYNVYDNGNFIANVSGLCLEILYSYNGIRHTYTVCSVGDDNSVSVASESLLAPVGGVVVGEIESKRADVYLSKEGLPVHVVIGSAHYQRYYKSIQFSENFSASCPDNGWVSRHWSSESNFEYDSGVWTHSVTGTNSWSGDFWDGTLGLDSGFGVYRLDEYTLPSGLYIGSTVVSDVCGYVGDVAFLPPYLNYVLINSKDANVSLADDGVLAVGVARVGGYRRSDATVYEDNSSRRYYNEYTDSELLGRAAASFSSAMAAAQDVPWGGEATSDGHGVLAYAPEEITESCAAGMAYRWETHQFDRLYDVNLNGMYYRLRSTMQGLCEFRWYEVERNANGHTVYREMSEVAFGGADGAVTTEHVLLPPECQGSVVIATVKHCLCIGPNIFNSELGEQKLYKENAISCGGAAKIDISLIDQDLDVPSSVRLRLVSTGGDYILKAVDPNDVALRGLFTALADASPIPWDVDLMSVAHTPGVEYPGNSPWDLYLVPTKVGNAEVIANAIMAAKGATEAMIQEVECFDVPFISVDANRDDVIIANLCSNDDTTNKQKPFRFWLNDDDDHGSVPGDIGSEHAPILRPDYTTNLINSQRDLEDYARLWISTQGLNAAFKNGDMFLGLKWEVSSGAPAIKVFPAVETDGGSAYLTDGSSGGIAQQQASKYALIDERYAGDDPGSSTHTTVGGTDVFVLPKSLFANLSETQPKTFLLFEGYSVGKGQLKLVILDKNKQVIGEGPGVWMDLHSVADFYDKACATNVPSGKPPSSLLSDFSVTWAAPSPAPDESKQVIIFVHGINNTDDDYIASSNTIYKRLYWAGYHGRFAAFRWPCAYLPPNTLDPYQFDLGEFYAFKSANALRNYVGYLRGRSDLAGYAIDVFAHSQGNVVASEAAEQGAVFDNYILTQGAIPAHCYDTGAPTLQKLLDAEASTPTPLLPINGGYHGYCAGLQGNLVNFYNGNDYALSTGTTLGLQTNWEEDQRTQKPEAYLGGPSYIYNPMNLTTVAYYTFGSHYTVTDLQETKAMVARSRSKAVGAQGGLHGVIGGSVDLFGTFGFGTTRDEHSAQFTRQIQTVLPYYQQMLTSFQILP